MTTSTTTRSSTSPGESPAIYLLQQIPLEQATELAETEQRIVSHRAPLRHDLMGRVYHRLLAGKKYLATYHTSMPAATMLLKLALTDDAQSAWRAEESLAGFRVADLSMWHRHVTRNGG